MSEEHRSAREIFDELLAALPPSAQEDMLFRAADLARNHVLQEQLKNIKAEPGKYVVIIPRMYELDIQEYDTLETARAARKGLLELRTDYGLGICIIDDNGNRLDEHK